MKFATQSEAKVAVKILEAVAQVLPRTSLYLEGSPYICDNITQVKLKINVPLTEAVTRQVRGWISEMLEHRFSLETWMQDKGCFKNKKYRRDAYVKELQDARHAWLQWMIQEIKTNNNLK